MKMNWKRNIYVVLAAVMMMAGLTACSSGAQVPGFDVSVRPADSSGTGTNTNSSPGTGTDISNNSGTGSTDNSTMVNNNNNSKQLSYSASDMESALTPPKSSVYASVYGNLLIQSSATYDELVAFYSSALKNLGVTEKNKVQSAQTQEWAFGGIYDNSTKKIIVLIIPTDEASNPYGIAIAYDTGETINFKNLPSDSIFYNNYFTVAD